MPARSKRLDNIPPYLFAEMSRIKAEMRAKGEDIIDLGIGDPDQPTPTHIIEALCKEAHNPATHTYDESPRGWRPYLDAAARWYQKTYGVALDAGTEMLEVIGSKEGLAHLVWAYVDEGDCVIVPNPGYPVYRMHSVMAGGRIYDAELKRENGFLPVLEDIPSEAAKNAKLFFVCYPNNPTGAVATADFYRDAVRFCQDYDILLVNDMAYGTVTYDGYVSPTALQQEGGKDVCIEFHSLSKMFNMTGWRIAFAAGNPDAIATLGKLKDNIDSKQFAAIAGTGGFALENCDNSATFKLYEKRRDILCDGLNDIGWRINRPKATFYIWAKVPRGYTSAGFASHLLQNAKVLCIPGNGYGSAGEGYVRMSLTVKGDRDGEMMCEAVRRIAACSIDFSA
ncbi:MAG: LL-diaminopimelate aminotransferase [Armatimonadetes bacterium]|nr:LL-diaminopimelate aminotransferase [Armatimonadota bacterium]